MQTFFQRYSDNEQFWMGCGHATKNIIDTSGGLSKEQIDFVYKLVYNGYALLNEKHRTYVNISKSNKVFLYDEKKWNAAICIQRMWLKCMYNPQYFFCRKIQFNNLQKLYLE